MTTLNKLVYSLHQSTKSEPKWLNGVISLLSIRFNYSNQNSKFSSQISFKSNCTSSSIRSSAESPFYNRRVLSQFSPQLDELNRVRSSEKEDRFLDKFTEIHQRTENGMKELPNYNEAIATLNLLQSNRTEIQNRIVNPITLSAKVKRTQSQLHYLAVSQDDLRSMNVIHISGTKGKGSTCAFIECILRKKGFKTGLFTSPHLISVRERIQLDGKPIEKDLFAKNFFHVYEQLKLFDSSLNSRVSTGQDQCSDNSTLPFYFNFLTLLALYTFKQQGCNATILEVGIGGEFDCTNIVDQPTVVGVSSLGIDHVKLLGSTLEEIAWHKAGIFKANVPAFTTNNQKIEALGVLLQRAEERNCPIKICPPLDEYQTVENRKMRLGINGEVQKLNASLALQICDYFISKTIDSSVDPTRRSMIDPTTTTNQLYANGFKLNNDYLDAIEECKWKGRFEVMNLKNKSTFYLDGAHTVESLNYCIDWFRSECRTIDERQTNEEKLYKILIFNCTGCRDYGQLLSPLLSVGKFDMVCFTTNLKKIEDLNDTKSDMFYAAYCPSNQDELKENVLSSLHFTGSVKHFDCLENCLKSIHMKNEENLSNNLKTKVLVTGSIHLIGGVISLLNEFYC